MQAYFWIYWNLLHLANMVTGDETGVILITLLQFLLLQHYNLQVKKLS